MRLAADILDRARTIIQDETSRRWPLAELCNWLNDGQLVTVTYKPAASATTVNVPLAEGTLQSIPTGYLSLLRVVRNVRGQGATRTPRRSISVVQQAVLDATLPAWHDPTETRFTQQVKHVIFDEANPKSFYVFPGNDGTGLIEAVLCKVPTPVTPSGPADRLLSYHVPIGLDIAYAPALLMYVLYMAYAKDAQFVGNAARSVAAYQQFANLLGVKLAVDASTSVNAAPGVGQTAAGVS